MLLIISRTVLSLAHALLSAHRHDELYSVDLVSEHSGCSRSSDHRVHDCSGYSYSILVSSDAISIVKKKKSDVVICVFSHGLFSSCSIFLLSICSVENNVCLHATLKTILCYFEASSKFYMNAVQTYLLLALNVCRCGQIVFNRNFYLEYPRWIVLTHCLIGILPSGECDGTIPRRLDVAMASNGWIL